MANILGQHLADKHVILRKEAVTGTTSDELSRLFLCQAGPGTIPGSGGRHITGEFPANPVHKGQGPFTIDAMEDIERLATPVEITIGGHG